MPFRRTCLNTASAVATAVKVIAMVAKAVQVMCHRPSGSPAFLRGYHCLPDHFSEIVNARLTAEILIRPVGERPAAGHEQLAIAC
jgi:hypothetical protein